MEARGVKYKHAVVVGTIRDGSANVVSDLLRILSAIESIVPASAFVVESDSSDDTVQIIKNLSEKDMRIRFKSLGNIANDIPDRIARLRYCRNVYVNEIRQHPSYQDCDLVIVADLDGINTVIDVKGFEIALNSEVEWDALAANQNARYYDIAALRHPLWSPNNFFEQAQWMAPYLGEKAAWRNSISDRMIHIPMHSPPILVESAFGGLCIYRRWVFEKCDYSEDDSQHHGEIDHVTINRKMRSFGGKIFIHPAFINANWTVHSLDGVPTIRFLKIVAHNTLLKFMLPWLRKLSLLMAKK